MTEGDTIIMTNYSNPRMKAVIENWPSGGKRITATFDIEVHPTRGERACRATTGAARKLTYARKARIVDGDDGRTYIARLTAIVYGHIAIMRGDMKYQHEVVHPGDRRYPELRKLFEPANEPQRTARELGHDREIQSP